MKKTIIFLLTIIIAGSMSCKKTESDKINDDIDFSTLNKTIGIQQNDSISGTCKDLVFEIISNNQTDFSSILRINSVLIECDGCNSILTNSDNEKVVPLNKDFEISETSHWSGIHDLILNDFAGKGEKYIGYRSCFLLSGIDNFNYGWIKIKLSMNNDTLAIISRATNNTNQKSIKTGQTE